jgi:hypothetical protein
MMAGFEELGRDVRRALDAEVDDGRLARQQERIARAVAARRRGPVVVRLALAAALLAAAGLVVPRFLDRAAPPSFRADGRLRRPGQWLEAPRARALPLRFSDGSVVRLEGGARGRVSVLTRRETRILVESGVVAADVRHRPDARWAFEAGPFEVRVVGTALSIEWDPDRGHLEVSVRRGEVQVTGGHLVGTGVTLRAGRTLFADLAAESAAVAPAAPVLPESTASPAPATAAPAVPRAPAAPSWKTLALAGDHRGALAEAERQGFETLIERLGQEDLNLVADSARLARNGRRAQQALGAVRRRFPGTHMAAMAAFRLGRLAPDLAGRPADAAHWFRIYLAEEPSGSFAAEARGRLVEALVRIGDRAGADTAARDYLAHHPDGAYADLARSALEPTAPP